MKNKYINILLFFIIHIVINHSLFAETPCVDEKDTTISKCYSPKRYLENIYIDNEIISKADITYSYYVDFLTNRALTLDYYSSVEVCEDRPFIVMVHGGGFAAGNKYDEFFKAKELASKGYAVFVINYRLMGNPSGKIPEQVNTTTLCAGNKFNDIAWYWAMQDINAALKHIAHYKNDYKIDPDKAFIYGGSAGAIATMQLAYASEQEVFDTWPGVNFNSVWFLGGLDKTTHPLFRSQTYTIKGIATAYGAVMRDYYIDNNETVPLIMLHNSCDNLVPYDENANRLGEIFGKPCHGIFYGSKYIYDTMESLPQAPAHQLYVDCATNPYENGSPNHYGNGGVLFLNNDFLKEKVPGFFYDILQQNTITSKIDLIHSAENYCSKDNGYSCNLNQNKSYDEEILASEFKAQVNNLLARFPNNSFKKDNLVAAPNPVFNETAIDFAKWVDQDVEINIFSFTGAHLLRDKTKINAGNTIYTINSADWPTGVYFVKLNSNGNTQTIELIKR